METDETVRKFLRAVRDLGEHNERGLASGEDIMRRMEWDPSDLSYGNPKNEKAREDGSRYRELARRCDKEWGFITWEADLYARVAITPKGERLLDGD